MNEAVFDTSKKVLMVHVNEEDVFIFQSPHEGMITVCMSNLNEGIEILHDGGEGLWRSV